MSKLSRRKVLKTAGIGAAATAIAAPAIAQPMPELKWRLTTSFPKSLDTLHGSAEIFAKAVADATDRRFQIQVFAAGEIAPPFSAADVVENGTVEQCLTASYYFQNSGFRCGRGQASCARKPSAWYRRCRRSCEGRTGNFC
jgi:TRAP-type mannitol/chloroaromatic compound transport system substrate-binding protein